MSVNVTTGPATLSWPHLAELEARNGNSKPKVSTAVMVPKSDTATIEALKAAVREAAAEKWGTKVPKSLRTPLKDGDNSDYEEQAVTSPSTRHRSVEYRSWAPTSSRSPTSG